MKEKKLNTLDILTSMHEAQAVQFQQATALCIGTVMRKLGVTEVTVEPDDLNSLIQGERLVVEKLGNGGLKYRFVSAPTESTESGVTKQ